MFRRIISSAEYAARPRASINWFVQRITGVVLAITLLAHVWMVHIGFGPAKPVSLEMVMDRLRSPGMLLFYLVFLYCGAWHGINGLLNVLDDYVRSDKWRGVLVTAAWVMGAFIVGMGTISVLR